MKITLWLLLLLQSSLSFAQTEYDKAEATLSKQYQTRKNFERNIDAQVNEPYEEFKKKWLSTSTHTFSEVRSAIRTLRQIEAIGESIKKQISIELGSAGQKQIKNLNGTLEHLRNVLTIVQDIDKNEPIIASDSNDSLKAESTDSNWTIESTKKVSAVSWKAESYIRCTGSRNRGDTFNILHLDNGRYQSVTGPTESSLGKVADFHCKSY